MQKRIDFMENERTHLRNYKPLTQKRNDKIRIIKPSSRET